MKYLVSLPPNTVEDFPRLAHVAEPDRWFAASDPAGAKVGSGGGTVWLLYQSYLGECAGDGCPGFIEWLGSGQRVVVHAGGQSRRLPAYAAMGKLMLPVPVFRWARGQRLDQTLLDLQLPLLRRLLDSSGASVLVASGDALILAEQVPPVLPQADVVCIGVSVDPAVATRHGVFICPRADASVLHCMLQKPSIGQLQELSDDHLFMIDSGIWLLSSRALEVLSRKCGWEASANRFKSGIPSHFDLYGNFGLALGTDPGVDDPDIGSLSTAVVYLPQASFHHFGSTSELVSSSLALQNRVSDQRSIHMRSIKPHPAMFVQNAAVEVELEQGNAPIWIENSHINTGWNLASRHVLTGIPRNGWKLSVPDGICLDIVPVRIEGVRRFAIRPYGWLDTFSGNPFDEATSWMGAALSSWFIRRGLDPVACVGPDCVDIQEAPLFPVLGELPRDAALIQWLVDPEARADKALGTYYAACHRMSASQLSVCADLEALEAQRVDFRKSDWQTLASNYRRSVFYQVDLSHAATEWQAAGLPVLDELPGDAPVTLRMHNLGFRHRLGVHGAKDRAYGALRETILEPIRGEPVSPVRSVLDDQIVWCRSPVRIDFAGGWTDTPPYCLTEGGRVVNIALELNGQPPLQVFIKPCDQHHIVLRSIDLGMELTIVEYSQLEAFRTVGSSFAIPLAALALCGFSPAYSRHRHVSLATQLEHFGSGFEMTFMAAVPKGSGLGTSSILASTIFGALSDFCSLGWDHVGIGRRTLALEQLLTTGGGWQDQFGGMYAGVKLVESEPAMLQSPKVRWLPERLFGDVETKACMLLYYTGVTRVARNILVEIVEGMFLNQRDKLAVLRDIKEHAGFCADAIQHGSYGDFADAIARSWRLNKLLDPDTTNPEIEKLAGLIQPHAAGFKLAGAGGGGYMYILAKDPDAAVRIRATLQRSPLNACSRFVDMNVSENGLQVTRS